MADGAWQQFKEDPNPVTTIDELQQTLARAGFRTGRNTLYREAKAGSLFGAPTLHLGLKRMVFSRRIIVETIEGTR